MAVLLTGGTGMLGSHLAAALIASGREVRCLVRRPDEPSLLDELPVRRVRGDVLEPDSLRRALEGVDEVVHAAGVVSYWRRRDAELERVNVGGTRNLLEAAVAAGARRFLLTSSIATLGHAPPGTLGDERTPWNWTRRRITYLETKRAAEAMVLAERRLEGLAVNPGITFGPRDLHMNGGRMFAQACAGGPAGIPPGGTTAATIQDVVAGHLAALERGRAGERYVLGGHPLAMGELLREIASVVGVSPPRLAVPAPLVRLAGQLGALRGRWSGREPDLTPELAELIVHNRRYSSAKATRELGYAVSPLRPCLEASFAWYVERGMLPARRALRDPRRPVQ